jgi:hypothetical protein
MKNERAEAPHLPFHKVWSGARDVTRFGTSLMMASTRMTLDFSKQVIITETHIILKMTLHTCLYHRQSLHISIDTHTEKGTIEKGLLHFAQTIHFP